MTVKLPTTYMEARRALAAAHRVDEVNDFREKARAIKVYAAQAKDRDLIEQATDIRLRAEIRAGELLIEMAKSGERAVRKNMKSQRATSKLSDLGVHKAPSSRWQKLVAMPPEKQEQTIRRRVQIAVAAAEDDKAVISAARADRHAAKHKRREVRERALAGKVLALPQEKYGVILADVEWRWKAWSEKGLDSASADNPLRNPRTVCDRCGLGMYCRKHRPTPNKISPERAPPPRSQPGNPIGGIK